MRVGFALGNIGPIGTMENLTQTTNDWISGNGNRNDPCDRTTCVSLILSPSRPNFAAT